MKKKIVLFILLFLATAAWSVLAEDVYTVDPAASAVRFQVIHLGVPFVRGRFEKFEGKVFWEGKKLVGFDGKVDMTSLKTGNRTRDRDLKSKRFFAVEQFPAMTIKSKSITEADGVITIQSDLTIRDITKVVGLTGTVSRSGDKKTVNLTLSGVINRMEYGLKLPSVFEFFIGNPVNISLILKAQI